MFYCHDILQNSEKYVNINEYINVNEYISEYTSYI